MSLNSLNSLNLIWWINLFHSFSRQRSAYNSKKRRSCLFHTLVSDSNWKLKLTFSLNTLFLRFSRLLSVFSSNTHDDCYVDSHIAFLFWISFMKYSLQYMNCWLTVNIWCLRAPRSRVCHARVLARLVRVQPGNGQQFCSVK